MIQERTIYKLLALAVILVWVLVAMMMAGCSSTRRAVDYMSDTSYCMESKGPCPLGEIPYD